MRGRRGVGLAVAGLLAWFASGAAGQSGEPMPVLEFGGFQTPPPGQLAEGGRATVAVDRDGNVWVADAANDRLVKFDFNGSFIAAFGRPRGGGAPAFDSPVDIAADKRGNIFVIDERGFGTASSRIVVLNTSGRHVRTFALPPTSSGLESDPNGIATDSRNRVYVSDTPNRRIVVLTGGGTVRRIVPVTFNPTSLDVGGTEIYVSDQASTIHRLAGDGTELNAIALDGGVSRGIAVFGTHVYVADADQLRRHIRDLSSWRFLTEEGEEPLKTNEPTGVAVDCRGNVYVTDSAARDPADDGTSGPSKVVKLSPPGALPPPCTPVAPPTEPVDTQVNDIEVTQGTQWRRSFTATDAATGPRTRAYSPDPSVELPLRQGGRTVVRVYASLRSGDDGGVAGVPATLTARAPNGRALGPLAPDAGPAVLRVEDTVVEGAERTDPAGAYTFTLPDEWTRFRSLDLTAQVNPAGIGCDDACRRRSTFLLSGVPFRPTTRGCSISAGGGRPRPACDNVYGVDIKPLALTFNGQYPVLPGAGFPELREPGPIFAAAHALTPAELLVAPWYRTIEMVDIAGLQRETIRRCAFGIDTALTCVEETVDIDPNDQDASRKYVQGKLMDRIDRVKKDNTVGDATILLGLRGGPQRNDALLPGAMRGRFLEGQSGLFALTGARGYADVDRPLGAVAHELHHALGRRHAGDNPSCYPEDQLGEPWPDGSGSGSLLGVGLDTRSGSGGGRGPYAVIAPGVNGYGSVLRDLMSYCAPTGENDMWVSPIGWNQIIDYNAPRSRRRSATAVAARSGRLLRVTAVELSDGRIAVTGSRPDRGKAPASDAGARYVLEARDEAGVVLAAAPALREDLADDNNVISGAVALPPAATQVTLRRGTEEATQVRRSASAPTVRLTSPRKGRLRGANVVVRWRSHDGDQDALTATVEYSPRAGRAWRAVWAGPASQGTARLPISMFASSRNARIRVRVDDGFREAGARSDRLRIDGAPPIARIAAPAPGLRLRADGPLLLEGEGFASGGDRLAGAALRWFDGRRPIGRGVQLSTSGLTPGAHTLRLVATAGGRRGVATTRVTVLPVAPAFLRLQAPPVVGPRARVVVLRVAATVASRLRAGGRTFRVDRASRRIRVPIRRGTGPLSLRLSLRAGGATTTQVVSIARG